MARTYIKTLKEAAVEAVNDALAQPKLPSPDEIEKDDEDEIDEGIVSSVSFNYDDKEILCAEKDRL